MTVVKLILEGEAREALSRIAILLGETEAEAVQRALGVELYLLQQVREGGRVFVHSKNGNQLEVDLLG